MNHALQSYPLCSFFFSYFLLLSSKYSPKRPVLKDTQFTFFPYSQTPTYILYFNLHVFRYQTRKPKILN
jgi:hypothetical protein